LKGLHYGRCCWVGFTLEDKIVQGAIVMLLNAIYEGDFCGLPDSRVGVSDAMIGSFVITAVQNGSREISTTRWLT